MKSTFSMKENGIHQPGIYKFQNLEIRQEGVKLEVPWTVVYSRPARTKCQNIVLTNHTSQIKKREIL